MSKKLSIDDIFNDDEFGLLESKAKTSNVKSEEDRLLDSFEEINSFFEKNNREPGAGSMSEYALFARLKNFKENEKQKVVLKPFDRFNLLGHVEMKIPTIDEVLNEPDDFGLLDTAEDLSIFKMKNVRIQSDRAESEYVAQRKPMKEEEFLPYEKMFQTVHKEIKEGKRKIKPFKNIEKNLHIGDFYILDGVVVYLISADLKEEQVKLKSGNRLRIDGRTMTIFENGTYSNMLYRSLGKQIQKNGKLITNTDESVERELFVKTNKVKEEDIPTGWIYILKSKSSNPNISIIENLYKIGFSSVPVGERIRNAKNEATYLFSDVEKVQSYKCYNRNADKLEPLLHRFFAKVCLAIDLFDERGLRISPREWFVVPFEVIEEAIVLTINGSIIHYEYNAAEQKIKLKKQ